MQCKDTNTRQLAKYGTKAGKCGPDEMGARHLGHWRVGCTARRQCSAAQSTTQQSAAAAGAMPHGPRTPARPRLPGADTMSGTGLADQGHRDLPPIIAPHRAHSAVGRAAEPDSAAAAAAVNHGKQTPTTRQHGTADKTHTHTDTHPDTCGRGSRPTSHS